MEGLKLDSLAVVYVVFLATIPLRWESLLYLA